jgi:hypothetical protein
MTTGSWENFIRESIGRHEFRNATATVKVEAASATEGGLLRLRQIELVKVVGASDAGGAAASSPEPARVLQSLRTRHRGELREAASAVRARYSGEWLKLEPEFAASGDSAAAAAVARSRARMFPPASNEKDEGADVLSGLDPEPEEKRP